MVKKKILAENKIHSWETLRSESIKPDLLLGNGFTLQFSSQFNYKSLFDLFLKGFDEKDTDIINVYKSFNSSNFEVILKFLEQSVTINKLLSLDFNRIQIAIKYLKEGLIKTIVQVHKDYNSSEERMREKIEKVAEEITNFGNIFTTNYDLYLYWIIMNIKERDEKQENHYQDLFWYKKDENEYTYFAGKPLGCSKKIFYLHGALFIYQKYYSEQKKIKRNKAEKLIDLISKEIHRGNIPIFISESEGRIKEDAIRKNEYLNFCLQELEASNNPIMIFGNTLYQVDKHLIEAIKKTQRNIYYCIYTKGKNLSSILKEKHSFSEKFNIEKWNVEFVDAETVFKLN